MRWLLSIKTRFLLTRVEIFPGRFCSLRPGWRDRVSVERPPSLIHDDRHKPVPDRETDGPTGRQRSGPSKTSKLQVSLCQSLDWLELVLPCMTYFSYGSAPQFSGIERHSVTSLPVGGRILS